MEKPTLGRSEASYPPPRSAVPLFCTFCKRSGSSENRTSSEAVQIHGCTYDPGSRELTLIGLEMPAETRTFSFLQCVHAPGLSERGGCQRSDRRKEGWEEEAPAIAKTRKGTPTPTGNDVYGPRGNSGDIAERVAYSLVGKTNSDPRGGCVR